jgi:hypothetical protein
MMTLRPSGNRKVGGGRPCAVDIGRGRRAFRARWNLGVQKLFSFATLTEPPSSSGIRRGEHPNCHQWLDRPTNDNMRTAFSSNTIPKPDIRDNHIVAAPTPDDATFVSRLTQVTNDRATDAPSGDTGLIPGVGCHRFNGQVPAASPLVKWVRNLTASQAAGALSRMALTFPSV